MYSSRAMACRKSANYYHFYRQTLKFFLFFIGRLRKLAKPIAEARPKKGNSRVFRLIILSQEKISWTPLFL